MSSRKKYAFYISGKSSRLLKYLNSTNNTSHIHLVFSDCPIDKKLASVLSEKNIFSTSINYSDLDHSTTEKRHFLSEYLMRHLIDHNIDYCFSFGEHILVGDLLTKYKNKIINFHPSILPMYPGLNAIDQAIKANSTILVGNTAHFIDSSIDGGPIIMQSVIPLQAFFNNNNNYDIILDIQIEMLKKIITLLDSNRIQIINNKVIISGANYNIHHLYPET